MTDVAKNMRLHELAKELGMTNQEVVDLCGVLGVPVKSHSSSLNEAYADMVRRRAHRDGLTRPEQPEEPKPERAGKKSTAKKSAAAPPQQEERAVPAAAVAEPTTPAATDQQPAPGEHATPAAADERAPA